MRGLAFAALLLCLLLAQSQPVTSQFGGKPKAGARREDVPLIKCQVCNLLATNAFNQAQDLKAKSTPSKKVDEMAVIELIEQISTSWKEEGDWITGVHLEASGSTLKVVDKKEPGECGEACKTVERAAQDIIGEHDTDIAEALFVGRKKESEFKKWLCNDLTTSCTTKTPSVPKGHKPYAAFAARGSEPNMDRMMKEMEAQGLKGQMWSRDDLMNNYLDEDGMMGGMGGMGDPYGDMGGADLSGFNPDGMENVIDFGDDGPPMPSSAKDAVTAEERGAAAEEAQKLWDEFHAEKAAKEGAKDEL